MEIIKNKKGFTLIELITTIALLAVIVLISFVSVNRVIEKNKINTCNSISGNIRVATNEYISDNRYKLNFINNADSNDYVINLTAADLINGNYLSSPIVNPWTNKNINALNIKIKAKLNNNYTVNNVEIIEPSVLVECTKTTALAPIPTITPTPTITATPTPTAIPTPTIVKKAYLKDVSGYTSDYKENAYREKIKNVYFVNHQNIPSNRVKEYILDEGYEGLVKGWIVSNPSSSSYYDLYIGANSTIYARTLKSAFDSMIRLEHVDFSNLDTSETTNMASMFAAPSSQSFMSLKSLTGLSHFDTSKVTNMGSMFFGCGNMKTIDVSYFDTSSVTNMGMMFSYCRDLETLDLSKWNTSKVRNMAWMFAGNQKLTNLNLKNMNTSSVESMSYMFLGIGVKELDLSSFNTANVTDMSSMFNQAKSEKIYVSNLWNTNKVTSSSGMFYECKKLPNYNYSNSNDKTYAHYNTGGYLTYKAHK